MSREELLTAFVEGRVSRRSFVRRLVAGGVSLGAAVSYAQMISPERADAVGPGTDDFYPLIVMTLKAASLATVINNHTVRADLTSSEEIPFIFLRALLRSSKGLTVIGTNTRYNAIAGPGSFSVNIPISVTPLQGRSSAVIYVQAQGHDGENFPALAVAHRLYQ
jgi:hypothetical protein